ncbi:MAG: beta-galactosidase trimerization domain-containing protein [Oscillospiraceae bacterium]|nr:beta-galactosidase trimerization domain-containing protein [Oscillospiraceae bacterium]
MEKNWYKSSFIRNLVDMHIPSGDDMLVNFDGEAYAENMKAAGVDTAFIYASNCLGLCLYPTEYGIRHSEAEKRDVYGSAVEACRKRGINVVGYLNSLATAIGKIHPEWLVSHDGQPNGKHGRYLNCCINTPYRKFFLDIVREMCSKYEIDGLWVDMIGYWTPKMCDCPFCREQFFEKTGHEMPDKVNWYDPVWVELVRFREDSITSYARDIVNTAKTARPGILVELQCAPILSGPYIGLDQNYYAITDCCAGDFYTQRDGCNVISRMLYKLSPNLPFEYMATRCADLSYHTLFKPIEELTAQACAALLYGGSFLFIDAIDPDGGMNADFYKRISVLKDYVEPFTKYVDYEGIALRDVAVYMNFDSFINVSNNNTPYIGHPALSTRLHQINRALSREHIDYDILTRKNIGELQNYKVIILPDLPMLNEEEVAAIREYVNNGGKIYISGMTSLLRNDGVLMDNFMLADVIGADYNGSHEMFPTYIVPVNENKKIFDNYTEKYPHMLNSTQHKITPREGTEVIAKVKLPYSNADNMTDFITALSNPPWTDTDSPSIIKNKFGKGEVIYSSGVIEDSPQRDNLKLFTNLIKSLHSKPRVKITAPDCIDYTIYKRESSYCVGILNHQMENIPALPVYNITVKFNLDKDVTVQKVFKANGRKVKYSVYKNWITFKIKKLELFEMIIIET